MYTTDHDTVEYMVAKFTKKDSYSSYHLNQKLKLLEYGNLVQEKIKKINAKNVLLLNTLEYITPNKPNLTKQEIDEHFCSLDEQKLKTFFLRIYKSGSVDDVHDIVNIFNNVFLNNNNVPEGIKYQTRSLTLKLLAQRTQLREFENAIGTKYLNYSDKYT